jgi:hypothetical protein
MAIRLRRAQDHAQVRGDWIITWDVAEQALDGATAIGAGAVSPDGSRTSEEARMRDLLNLPPDEGDADHHRWLAGHAAMPQGLVTDSTGGRDRRRHGR